MMMNQKHNKPRNIAYDAFAVSLVLGGLVAVGCYFLAKHTFYEGGHLGFIAGAASGGDLFKPPSSKPSEEYIDDGTETDN